MKKTKNVSISEKTRSFLQHLALGGIILGLITYGVQDHLTLTPLLDDLTFVGATLLVIGSFVAILKLEPNTDAYRCKHCGHTHVPTGGMILSVKKRLECPSCGTRCTHEMVK